MTSVSVDLNGTPVALGVVVADVTVRSGRERADDGLSASSATVDLLTPNPLGGPVVIGDELVITADGVKRFSGVVSEITMTAGGSEPARTPTTVVAVGAIARLARLLVAVPLAAATAAARAETVFAACGIPCRVAGGTTYQLAAYGADGDPPATADQVVGAIMADTGAVVADGGDGTIVVQFPEARISGDQYAPDPLRTTVELAFDMADDLVNDCTVEWAATPPAHATNQPSIDRHDLRAVKLSTGLGDAGSASRRASSIVSRLAEPTWTIGSVETWDPAALGYQLGAILTIAPLPPSAPMQGSWAGVLEGWTDHYSPGDDGSVIGVYDLAIGDRRHSAETLVWQAVTPTESWSTVNPATSWQEVVTNADL